jgi:hypothetical protein
MNTITVLNEQTDQIYTITVDDDKLTSYSEPCGQYTIAASEDPDGDCEAHVIDSDENKLLSTYGHCCLDDALTDLESLLYCPESCPDELMEISWYSTMTHY